MIRTNKKILESNLSMAKVALAGSIRKGRCTKEDERLVKKFEEHLRLLDRIGEEEYSRRYPYG